MKKLSEYLRDIYFKGDQSLYLHSRYGEADDIKQGTYFEQEIFVAEYPKILFDQDLRKEAKRLDVPLEALQMTHENNVDEFLSSYDKFLFRVQTLSNVMLKDSSKLGTTPYYKVEDGWRVFTVQRFGSLTEKDIHCTIKYFLRFVADIGLLFNIYYNDTYVSVPMEYLYPDYKKSQEDLKAQNYWKEKKYPEVWI